MSRDSENFKLSISGSILVNGRMETFSVSFPFAGEDWNLQNVREFGNDILESLPIKENLGGAYRVSMSVKLY